MSKREDIDKSEVVAEKDLSAELRLPPGEVVIARLVSITSPGEAQVSFSINNQAFSNCAAKSTIPLKTGHVGREVVIMFINQDISQAIITGLVHGRLESFLDMVEVCEDQHQSAVSDLETLSIGKDQAGKTVCIKGKDQISLQCGDASITLTSEGKIILRGRYIQSRSSGVQRIQGASVQVN